MPVGSEDRAVSTLVGAVIVFAFIILFMALWQTQVVPQQNAAIEFNHNLDVQDDLADARNAIVSAPGGGNVPSISIDMAPTYPARTLFFNPAPPQGSLRTAGTTNDDVELSVDNATVADAELGDFWSGTERAYTTGILQYRPEYNAYTTAPATVYDNTLLYNRHGGGVNITVAEQAVVDGDTIKLIAINGSLSRNQAQSYAIDFETLSSSDRSVAITNDGGGNITISFPSRLNATQWNETFAETGELVSQGGHVVDVRSTGSVGDFIVVTVELEGDTTYTLRMAKVGVGEKTTTPEQAYLIDVRGDNRSITTEGSQELVVEVRDAFNNPVSGVSVRNNSTSDLNGGSLDAEEKTTDSNGQATFEFTPGSTGTATIVFNMSDDGTVTAEETVSFSVNVTGAGGVSPSLTELTVSSTNFSTGPTSFFYENVSFTYSVSDDSEVANITVRILTKDGNEITTKTRVVDAVSDSGTIQVDISDEEIDESTDLHFELIVFDDVGNTETDTGIVPKP